MSGKIFANSALKSKGCPIEILQNIYTSECYPIENKPNHTVLYNVPITTDIPMPHKGKLYWDKDHVKMPSSSHSLYTAMEDGHTILKPRWELIKDALSQKITCSEELQEAILTYNPKYKNDWKFTSLHTLFNEILEEDESNYFFEYTLPSIIHLALELPNLVATGLPHLRQNRNHSVSLSQQQVSSLLANAFLCTFPHRNTQKKQSEYNLFPDINFNRLFDAGSKTDAHVIEKLKCICHYFRRVCQKVPRNVITFTRQHISNTGLPNWAERNEKLGDMRIHVSTEGTIEDQGINMLQVDFANKYIGGGVLGWGCVQEEIRFVISPELIISRLFTEALKPNEALIITGCERFSKYEGYSQSFSWAGDYQDDTPCDLSRRRKCTIVAIDALHFSNSKHQFLPKLLERELNKAYVGFRPMYGTSIRNPLPVATGNWGCGAFGGEANLKALLQIMAARVVQRDFVYFTFGDQNLCENLYKIWSFFKIKNVTVGELWNYLCAFHKSNSDANKLYPFLMQIQSSKDNKDIKNDSYNKVCFDKSITKPANLQANVTTVANSSNLTNPEELIEEILSDNDLFDDSVEEPVVKMKQEYLNKISLVDSLSALEESSVIKNVTDKLHRNEKQLKVESIPKNTNNKIDESCASDQCSNHIKRNTKSDERQTQQTQQKISDFFIRTKTK